LISNPRPHEAQLEDQKPKKSSRRPSLEEEKPQSQQKTQKSGKPSEMAKKI
jgi:hypothetical protein